MNQTTYSAFSDEFQKIAISMERIKTRVSRAKVSPARLEEFGDKMWREGSKHFRPSGAPRSESIRQKMLTAGEAAFLKVEDIDAGNTWKKQGSDELQKIALDKTADIVVGPQDKHLTACGLYVSHPGGDHEGALKELHGLIQKHGTLQTARRAYAEKHPDHFITAAFRYDHAPSAKKGVYLHAGPTGGEAQSGFYNAVVNHGQKTKTAEEGGTPWQQKAKAMGGHLLAFGTGTAIGATAGYLVNEAVKAVSKKPEGIPTRYLIAAAPIIGAGFGLAYNLAKAKEMEEMTRVHKDPDHKPGAG